MPVSPNARRIIDSAYYSANDRYPWLALLLLLLSATAYFFWGNAGYLADQLRVQQDAVQHFLWLYDGAWGADFYARASGVIQPWGYKAVVALMGQFTDPLTVSRYGPLLLVWLTVSLSFGILRQFYPLLYAAAGALLVNHFGMKIMVGFLAHAWCVPVLLGYGYALVVVRKPWATGLALVLSALIYPPALLVNAGISGCWVLWRTIQRPKLLLTHWPLVVGLLAAVGIAGLQSWYVQRAPQIGPLFDQESLLSMPEFRGGGRVNFRSMATQASDRYFRFFLHKYLPLADGRWFAWLVVVTFAVTSWINYRKLGRLSFWLAAWAISTVLLFIVAKPLIPLLFIPDRYVDYPWLPLAPLLVIVCTGWFVLKWSRRWVTGLASAAILAYGLHYRHPTTLPYVAAKHDRELYTAVAALPDTVTVAGPPTIMSQVPMLSRRSVVVTQEAAHALYFRRYYDYVTPRLEDQLIAYTAPADSIQRVVEFAEKYGVDHFIVSPKHLNGGKSYAFEPHNQRYAAAVRDRSPKDFALLTIPQEHRRWLRDSSYFMVSTSTIRSLAATASED